MVGYIMLNSHTPFVSRDFSELRDALAEDDLRAGSQGRDIICLDKAPSETLRKLQEREFA